MNRYFNYISKKTIRSRKQQLFTIKIVGSFENTKYKEVFTAALVSRDVMLTNIVKHHY